MRPASKSRAAVETIGGCIWAMSGTGGRLVGVRVAERHTAEAFELFLIGPGDIVVGDRGYSRCRQWAYVLKLGGEVVVRVAVQQVPLFDEQGERLDVVAWLKELASDKESRVVAFE